MGVGGRIDIEPDNIGQLVDKLRLVGGLELPDSGGRRPCARQMRWTELALMPTAFAIMVAVQWVASLGGSVWVWITTRSTRSDPSGGMHEGLVLWCSRPSQPVEAFPPAPHAGFRFAGPAPNLIGTDAVCPQQNDLSPPDVLMPRITIPRERSQAARSAGLRVMEIPVRIRQTRT
jgi:hypothetical protein